MYTGYWSKKAYWSSGAQQEEKGRLSHSRESKSMDAEPEGDKL